MRARTASVGVALWIPLACEVGPTHPRVIMLGSGFSSWSCLSRSTLKLRLSAILTDIVGVFGAMSLCVHVWRFADLFHLLGAW